MLTSIVRKGLGTMTRKDYVAIAEALRKVQPALDDHGGSLHLQWAIDRTAIADVFENDNPRFDRERFADACEGR